MFKISMQVFDFADKIVQKSEIKPVNAHFYTGFVSLSKKFKFFSKKV